MISTLYYSFYFSTVAVFCIYIEYMSKDAIAFLHFTNAISILCSLVIFSLGVDSPMRSFDQGNTMEGYKSLEFISWVNSKFSRKRAYYFEGVTIIDPSQLSNTQEASNTTTVIKSSGPLSLMKELCKQHWVVFLLITLVKINIDFVWFLNTFTIQGNQSGDNSVFYNGMILGIASYTAFLTCGLVMKFSNFYKLQICHGLACVIIAIYKLACHYLKDLMSAN